MPTLEHNAIVEMFRESPTLAPAVLANLFHLEVPHHVSVLVVEPSLDQLMPIEFRADLVVELRDETAALVLAIVLEVQRNKDQKKKFVWPVYQTVVRATKGCPTSLLVVTLDADVAAWAGEGIVLGPDDGVIKPIVLGPAVVPRITDPNVAMRDVELSVLSAVVHGNGTNGLEVVQAALRALKEVDREHAMVYFQVIYNVLREPLLKALEALVMESPRIDKTKFPPFFQRFIDSALEEGELKGLQEGELKGELKGLREGELKGLRDALLRLITRAGIALSEEQRTTIQSCSNAAILDQWIDNVIGAKTAADILT